ncbi:MAG: hypothetical protein ABIQ31_06905 [Ferruginibacter sp.]
MQDKLIPPEIKGKNTDLETSVELETIGEAMDTFKRAHKRMLNPPLWHKLCGPASAEFILTGETDVEEHRLAKKGDHFRIDIPGPGPSAGGGYDWVKLESVEDDANPGTDEESCGIKLRAAARPGEEDNGTAHFFNAEATSSFIIQRKGKKVTASYHGRNEIPNTDTTKTSDKIRNSVVAMGAYAFLSELQWSALIKGFLEKEIGG